MCDIKLTLQNEDKDLLMTITPVKGQPKANLKKLQATFKLSTYSTFLLIDGAMELLLAEMAKSDESDESKTTTGISSIIANAVDANLKVTLGPENMSATLQFTAAYGGKAIENADVINVLKENDFTSTGYLPKVRI